MSNIFSQLKNKKRGMFLTELLVTILLIIIVMLAIIPMFAVGLKTGKFSKHQAAKINIAQQEVEKFNRDKFFAVLKQIEISKPAQVQAFKNGTQLIQDIYIVYVNPANGQSLRETEYNNQAGYEKTLVSVTYVFLKGDATELDDSMQITVKTQGQGQTNAITMTTILSRDRI